MFWAHRGKPCPHSGPACELQHIPPLRGGRAVEGWSASHAVTAAVPGEDKRPGPTLRSRLWPGQSKQAEAAHETFTSCCKQHYYPVFLPGWCLPCAFPLVVGQVLCCATLPKLARPPLLWLRRRKEAGGQAALQSAGLLGGRCCGSSGAGWGRELPSVGPKCHFWYRVLFKIGNSFHEIFRNSV